MQISLTQQRNAVKFHKKGSKNEKKHRQISSQAFSSIFPLKNIKASNRGTKSKEIQKHFPKIDVDSLLYQAKIAIKFLALKRLLLPLYWPKIVKAPLSNFIHDWEIGEFQLH